MSDVFTLLNDVIVPDVWVPYMIERTAELSAIFQSGVVSTDPEIDNALQGGGDQINMPFFKDLSGDDQVRQSDTAINVNKITTAKDIARLHGRAQAWGAEDLAAELSGADPMQAIGDLVAEYWARRWQVLLISTLTGVFADNDANDSGDLIHDVADEDGDNADDTNKIGSEIILDAKQKLGDSKDKLTAIAMHSVLHTRLQKLDLIDFQPDSQQDVGWGTYLGHSVIVDDGCPVEDGGTSGKKYTSYLFGEGAIGYGEGPVRNPVEVDRDSLNDKDILINRRNFLLHPRGIAWQEESVVNDFPTNDEVENAANWDRVYEKKNIRLVKLITNG